MEKRSAEVVNPHLKALDVRKRSPSRLLARFASTVHLVRGRVGKKKKKPESTKLQRRLFRAGLYEASNADTYVGLRILLPILMVTCGSFFTTSFAVLVGLAAAGFLLPDFILERKGKKRINAIRIGLPDTVDLLVICMDAGLGMDQAVQRTAEVLYIAYPDLCTELVFLGRLQAMGMETTKAWKQLMDRTKSPDIEQIANMLTQSETFGTPISDAMRVLADSLRIKRKQRAEEHAARSGVILLMPLVVFIFPVIFIILLGPAALSIMHGFAPMLHH
jgi:tight adherence protein C